MKNKVKLLMMIGLINTLALSEVKAKQPAKTAVTKSTVSLITNFNFLKLDLDDKMSSEFRPKNKKCFQDAVEITAEILKKAEFDIRSASEQIVLEAYAKAGHDVKKLSLSTKFNLEFRPSFLTEYTIKEIYLEKESKYAKSYVEVKESKGRIRRYSIIFPSGLLYWFNYEPVEDKEIDALGHPKNSNKICRYQFRPDRDDDTIAIYSDVGLTRIGEFTVPVIELKK